MPALTYPDQITYYGFCKTENPYVNIAFPGNPVNVEDVLREAEEIKAWVALLDGDLAYPDFDRRVECLEAHLALHAVATGAVVLSACRSDFLGNARPYEVEEIYEPLYRGTIIRYRNSPLLLSVLNKDECLATWRGFLELSLHPWFAEEPERFNDILHLFRALKSIGETEDWIVIGIVRSYYLHHG